MGGVIISAAGVGAAAGTIGDTGVVVPPPPPPPVALLTKPVLHPT